MPLKKLIELVLIFLLFLVILKGGETERLSLKSLPALWCQDSRALTSDWYNHPKHVFKLSRRRRHTSESERPWTYSSDFCGRNFDGTENFERFRNVDARAKILTTDVAQDSIIAGKFPKKTLWKSVQQLAVAFLHATDARLDEIWNWSSDTKSWTDCGKFFIRIYWAND